mmetsp:Transcript_39093/g.61875  ORF Transcript_39093/g.61875 Transcript_39093/m.61875 type:complete len:82 (-) Transcript_39093:31-276(-)
MDITIKTLTNKAIPLQINATATVLELKELIPDDEGIPVDQQRLIYKGKELLNDDSIESYNLEGDSGLPPVIHLCLKLHEQT